MNQYQIDPKKIIGMLRQIEKFLPSPNDIRQLMKKDERGDIDRMKGESIISNLNYVTGLLEGYRDAVAFYEGKNSEARSSAPKSNEQQT